MFSKLKPYLITFAIALLAIAVYNRLAADNPVKKVVANT